MTSVNEKSSRANIRIEIKNDITESEAMDVDATAEIPANEAEIEDGEISDCTEEHTQQQKNHRTIILNKQNESQNTDDGMATDAADDEFFGADAQEKRAKRFGLSSELLNDQQVLDLLDSLGITDEEKPNTRFEALHMYGTQEMSTQDIYAYFGKFAPNSVEWINDESCNVVWLDKTTAGRALNHLSKIIAGMPVRGHHTDPDSDSNSSKIGKKNGTSILLMDDTSKRAVNVSDLNIPIPPGYWRLGDPCPKAKHLLLRYAKRTDKKPFRAEKFSNKKSGGIRGITSESKRSGVKGNPWGRLAQDWNKDVLERPLEETPNLKPKTSKALLNRLGTTKKRSFSPTVSDDNDEEEEDKEPVKKSKVPRMRMYADEEEARVTKIKELKKIRALEQIEENIVDNKHVPDLRNRLTSDRRKPLITSRLQLRPTYCAPSATVKQEIKVTARNDFRKEPSESESEDEDELNVQQRSKVTVIVKKQSKPTVASTIWSRLAANDKNKQSNRSSNSNSNSKSNSSSSNSSNSDTNKSESESESDAVNSNKNDFAKTLNNPRPGFRKDLKSRLGLNNSEHKSPLRIEINNDHYDSK